MYQRNPLLPTESYVTDIRGSGLKLEVHKGGSEGRDVPHFHVYTPNKNKDDSDYFECCLEFRYGRYFNHKKLLHQPFNSKQKKQVLKFLYQKCSKDPKVLNNWYFLAKEWNRKVNDEKYLVTNKMPDYSGIPTIGTI